MENHTQLFKAIQDFVSDLDSNFGQKYLSVSLYHRLVSRTVSDDEPSIERHLAAFRTFFDHHPRLISEKQFDNTSATIKYSNRVFLDMAKIYTKTDGETHEYIYRHLVTIYSLLNPNTEKGEQALTILKQPLPLAPPPTTDDLFKDVVIPDTPEGNFIKEVTTDFVANMGDAKPEELMSNPFAMLTNPKLIGLMGKIGDKMKSGEIKMDQLMLMGLGMLQQTGKNTDGLVSAFQTLGITPIVPSPAAGDSKL